MSAIPQKRISDARFAKYAKANSRQRAYSL
jgi:hypothetical protein